MKIDKQIRDALKLKYQGEVASAKANITIYMNNSVGIARITISLFPPPRLVI